MRSLGCRLLSVGAIVVVGVSLGGCTSARPRASDPTGVVYSGPLASGAVYFAGSVRLSPPGAARPRLTWQQALQGCGDCDQGAAAHVSLAFATTPNSGKLRNDGTVKPALDRALSYVVISRDQVCPDFGGAAPPPGRSASAFVPAPCDTIEILDANSGKLRYSAYGKQ